MLPLNTIEKEMKAVCIDYMKGEEKMKVFTAINDFDGNEQFQVEAKNSEEAAFLVLEKLGWNLTEQTDDKM